jgi:membrane-associated phospholipid phosphatase
MRADRAAIAQALARDGVAGLARRLLGALWLIVANIGALFVLMQAYTASRKRWFLRPAEVAFDHALDLIALQEALRLDVELGMQRWALDHPWLIDAANLYYRNLKPAMYGSAVLALLLAPVAFRRIRTALVLATLIAWPWFALYPLAPPRFMGPYGYPFVDTIHGAAPQVGGANPYAAMPSMHIGWSALVALWLAAAFPRWRLGWALGAFHLGAMSFAVVVTGNHWVLDIVAGLAVAAVALLLARLLPEPAPWSRRAWRPLRRARGAAT